MVSGGGGPAHRRNKILQQLEIRGVHASMLQQKKSGGRRFGVLALLGVEKHEADAVPLHAPAQAGKRFKRRLIQHSYQRPQPRVGEILPGERGARWVALDGEQVAGGAGTKGGGEPGGGVAAQRAHFDQRF